MKFIQHLRDGFYLAQLEICDCQAVMELQQKIPEDEKKFVAFKKPEEILRNVSVPHYAVGVFDINNELVGTAFLLDSSPDDLTHGLIDRQITYEFLGAAPPTGVIATLIIDPAARGRGLMGRMLGHMETKAIKKEFHSLMARVVKGNVAAWTKFDEAGFEVIGRGINPTDGLARDVFLKNLRAKQCLIRHTAEYA